MYIAQKKQTQMQSPSPQTNAVSGGYAASPPTMAKSTTGVKKAGTSKFLTPAIPGGSSAKSVKKKSSP